MATAILDSDPNYRYIFCVHTPALATVGASVRYALWLDREQKQSSYTLSKLPYNYVTYANPGVERTTGFRLLGETIGKNCRVVCGGDWGLRRREQSKE